MPPLCRDCRHAKKDWFFSIFGLLPVYSFAKCRMAPSSQSIDLVTGCEVLRDYFYCSTERKGYMAIDCGPEGKNFSPKSR